MDMQFEPMHQLRGISLPLFRHTIDQAHLAFGRPPPLLNAKVKAAADVLNAQKGKNIALGFSRPPQALGGNEEEGGRRVEQILHEHNTRLDAAEFKQLMEYLKFQQEHQAARSRFIAQAAISACIVAVALLLLGLGNGNDTMQKALFGLLGTVLGYWLR